MSTVPTASWICREAKSAAGTADGACHHVFDRARARRARRRCDGVLLKPFAPNLLYARIGRLLRQRSEALRDKARHQHRQSEPSQPSGRISSYRAPTVSGRTRIVRYCRSARRNQLRVLQSPARLVRMPAVPESLDRETARGEVNPSPNHGHRLPTSRSPPSPGSCRARWSPCAPCPSARRSRE